MVHFDDSLALFHCQHRRIRLETHLAYLEAILFRQIFVHEDLVLSLSGKVLHLTNLGKRQTYLL